MENAFWERNYVPANVGGRGGVCTEEVLPWLVQWILRCLTKMTSLRKTILGEKSQDGNPLVAGMEWHTCWPAGHRRMITMMF